MNMEAFSGCMPNEAIYRMERASGTRISFASNTKQKSQKIKASIPRELNRKIAKLAVNTDESILANDMCTCCGKDGKRKMLYSTEGEALIVAEHRSKETGIPLHVYPCPNGCGFHLTSNQE